MSITTLRGSPGADNDFSRNVRLEVLLGIAYRLGESETTLQEAKVKPGGVFNGSPSRLQKEKVTVGPWLPLMSGFLKSLVRLQQNRLQVSVKTNCAAQQFSW